AVLPLAILSVASVAGPAALTDGQAAVSRPPADAGAAADPVVNKPASRQVPARATPSSAPAAISAISATPSQVVTDVSPSPDTFEEPSTDGSADGSTDGSTDSQPETSTATDSPVVEAP